jgi:hypothetical protein
LLRSIEVDDGRSRDAMWTTRNGSINATGANSSIRSIADAQTRQSETLCGASE